MTRFKLAIIVGGGPAPGINAVIGAATIEAINHGMSVVGMYEGFKWLASDKFVPERHAVDLRISDVGRIHFTGGSLLMTSRTTLLDEAQLQTSTVVTMNEEKVALVLRHLIELGITHLLTIGGDDTALSARFVAEKTGGRIRVVHVPKTIDNDLPLPGDIPTFGFATARHIGSGLVANLMEDARTTGRWFIVVAMGRHAGFLALGVGKSTGATLTLIPETFPEDISFGHLVDVIEGSIIKRRAMQRPYGVVVIAEGLAYRLGDREEIERLLGKKVPLDAAGHLRLAEVPMARLVTDELNRRFGERNDPLTVVPQTLGYMLRCASPVPFDMAYCRDLGNGAIRLLLDTSLDLRGGVMVTIQGSNLRPLRFSEMVDPETNRTRVRTVDTESDAYRGARAYMICLEKSDIERPAMLAKLAAAARLSEDEFVVRYRRAAEALAYKPVSKIMMDSPPSEPQEP